MKKKPWVCDQRFTINAGHLSNAIQFMNKFCNWLEKVVKILYLEICYKLSLIQKFRAYLNVNYIKTWQIRYLQNDLLHP